MAWDEWEQLKAEAAGRGSTRMRLNSIPSDPGGDSRGGSSDRLKSDKKAWVKAGEDVTGLKDGVGKALTKLDDGQSGLGDTAGCRSAAAQKELYDSWKKYVGDVGGRCGELGGLLERSGHDLNMLDSDVEAELDKIKAKYQDTDPVMCPTKDK
ncbi:hypothetical protein JS756_09150 [Streptomyces actuosus]|uniref:Amino acid ABC transporter permease n=1 Tax=Streptomyces actuosus TaxID=1885 RepID=A0ABS2VMD5_STRAS|nr:hypothetical protein [Streptomyces actuosus]MBN0044274.1 hypothetical protein [Streptomyces actuosus]